MRGGGEVVGTFILTPTPATPISHEQCMVAVALADQLGATMATQGTEAETAGPRRCTAQADVPCRRRKSACARDPLGSQHAPEWDDQRAAPARCSAAAALWARAPLT